jgi:hypothetical protein
MSKIFLSGSNIPTAGINLLLHTRLNGIASEKMIILVITIVRTSNLASTISLMNFCLRIRGCDSLSGRR